MQEIDIRRHSSAVNKALTSEEASSLSTTNGRGLTRLFGQGGALENIMRRTYAEGLVKLNTNTFETKEAKSEWQDFVDSLSQEDMALVTAESWE